MYEIFAPRGCVKLPRPPTERALPHRSPPVTNVNVHVVVNVYVVVVVNVHVVVVVVVVVVVNDRP
ncbi:hypothetical protein [Sorangium sp. So ce124]|uniref:hypothetical protein n=1 Tax=Sorangium sp. So ce124 TaxID=3133280 RepID=UPI003F6408A6